MKWVLDWLARTSLAPQGAWTDTGLEVTLRPAWAIPLWGWALAAVVGGALVYDGYRRGTRDLSFRRRLVLAALRGILVGLVLALLPGWQLESYRTELPELVLLLDDSASMGLTDELDDAALARYARQLLALAGLREPTRLDLAKAILLKRDGEWLKKLAQRYRVHLVRVGQTLRPLSDRTDAGGRFHESALRQLAAQEPASRLGDCLVEALQWQRGRGTAAVVLFSDGIVTEGLSLEEAARQAQQQGVPVFAVAVGSERTARDLALIDLVVDETVLVNDWVVFEAKLVSGGIRGQAVVQLRRRDGSAVLAEQRVKLDGADETRPVRLLYRAQEPGTFDFILEVLPQEGEVDVENNQLTARVTVKEATLRVLVVQGYPSYEFRFLKSMLLRELDPSPAGAGKSQTVHTVLQEADLDYADTDRTALRTFPTSRDELFAYDVVVWGDVNPALLGPRTLQHLAEFVTERGGGVAMIAGPRYFPQAYRGTPLEGLLPTSCDQIRPEDFSHRVPEPLRPRLTPLGQASPFLQLADDPDQNPALWEQGLPPLFWYASVASLRPGVRVLAVHPKQRGVDQQPLPLICLQFVGAGKVLFHATDETYRWRYRLGDVYFARYWLQAIRYLSRAALLGTSHRVELRSDRSQYLYGEPVTLRLRFFDERQAPDDDARVTVAVQASEGERQIVTLARQGLARGDFASTLSGLAEGSYRAWLVAPGLEGPPQCTFRVVAPPGELARTRADLTALQGLAQRSGGQFAPWHQADTLLAHLPPGRQVRVQSLPPRPIWNHPLVGLLLVTLLTTEWLLRRRSGLE